MSNPLQAAYFADKALQQTVEILENVQLARETYRVRFAAPQIARRILPGQFLMLRLSDYNDPLIGRPLALYDMKLSSSGEPEAIDVAYLAKGKFTSRLKHLQPGQQLDVWGPLGNGFEASSSKTEQAEHLIMVAGGIGQTPFLAMSREALGDRSFGDPPRTAPPVAKATLCYGARSAEYLAGVEDFQSLGVDLRISTDDGSRGHHGFVTDLLEQTLAETGPSRRIICCGPEPMMAAVAKIAAQTETPCQVSLETPMACGVGICFTCVAKIRDASGQWDYKRTCIEGPVFDAAKVEW